MQRARRSSRAATRVSVFARMRPNRLSTEAGRRLRYPSRTANSESGHLYPDCTPPLGTDFPFYGLTGVGRLKLQTVIALLVTLWLILVLDRRLGRLRCICLPAHGNYPDCGERRHALERRPASDCGFIVHGFPLLTLNSVDFFLRNGFFIIYRRCDMGNRRRHLTYVRHQHHHNEVEQPSLFDKLLS